MKALTKNETKSNGDYIFFLEMKERNEEERS